MQLYILDRNPILSAIKIPSRYKFKMLLELAQMVSTLTGIGYKPIKQGKKLVAWIGNHKRYIYYYFGYLYFWACQNVSMKNKTKEDLYLIWQSLKPLCGGSPTYAYFRYRKDYECDVKSDEVLPLDRCIVFYTKYLRWKDQKTG